MYITAMKHPDHNAINKFCKNNKVSFKQVFAQVLLLAQATGLSKNFQLYDFLIIAAARAEACDTEHLPIPCPICS
ncbi:MAG: hypothetical protein IJ828_11095 [Treponema sp.]|nr:hypothetical protein [Treponema sp.]